MCPCTRTLAIVCLACTLSRSATADDAPGTPAARPNFLIVLADDCTFSDLPLYGGQNARTPHLDQLAQQGLTFNRAYLTMSMCQPCRSELYSGRYPMGNGCAWNHSSSLAGTHSLPHFLGPLGYRVGLAGKVHVLPQGSYPFESVGGYDDNCVRNPTQAHNISDVREFINRNQREPFCLVVALVEPHVPWVMGDASQYPTGSLKLPPHIADTPRTREDFAHYLAEITYMDGQVGELLAELRASGRENDTLVIFSSEQGSQFPGCKWTCWDTGLHTALIARWPGRITDGQRTDAMVQYVDVAPTLLELAGGRPDDSAYHFDGRSFAAVLRGETETHRDVAFGAHNNIPEGPAYPVRTVTNGDWRYIRNLTPDELYIEKHLMGLQGDATLNNPYWSTWIGTAWDTPDTYRLVKRYMRRPAEELYHTAADPAEMTNLADDPKHAQIKSQLSSELDRWLSEQGDPGIPLDTHEAHRAAKRGAHLYAPTVGQ